MRYKINKFIEGSRKYISENYSVISLTFIGAMICGLILGSA